MLITQLDTYSGLGGFLLNTPVSMYTLSDVNQLVCYLLTYNNPILQIWEWGSLNRPIFVHKGTPDSLVSPANPLVAGQFVIRYMPCRLAICVKFWSFTVQKLKFSFKDFFSKCDQNPQLVTFAEEILSGKLHFSCSAFSEMPSVAKLSIKLSNPLILLDFEDLALIWHAI